MPADWTPKHSLFYGELTIDDDDRDNDPNTPWTVSCSKCLEGVAFTSDEAGAFSAAGYHHHLHETGALPDQSVPTVAPGPGGVGTQGVVRITVPGLRDR